MKQTNLQNKIREKFIKQGVKMIAPDTVFFSNDTRIGKNVTIEPYVVFGKKVKIKNNVKILSFSHLEGVKIDDGAMIGPFARLRPGTILEKNTKVGNFVEVKKSRLSKNSKNIGAGTITCNYDGVRKNKTLIKDNVFIGSNTSLVAPVKIEKNSTVGAGSVITKNVKQKSLALTRSQQVEIKNYKRKK